MPRAWPFVLLGRRAVTWRQMVGFMALCLSSSLAWLAGDLLPVGMGSLAGQGLRLLLVGLGGAAVALIARSSIAWGTLAKVAGMGVLLVGLPCLLLDLARGAAPASLGVVAFALAPVGLMIVRGGMRFLPWGLAGVAGVLVLLPVTLPETGRGFVGVGLLLSAAGATVAGLAGMPRLLRGVSLAGAVAAVGLGSGGLLVLAGLGAWRWDAAGAEAVRAVAVDLPQIALLVWLVKEVSPLRVSARYLVAPLLTVAEGWFVVREGIGVRMVFGTALLACGAYGLLHKDVGGEEAQLDLR